MAFDVRYNYFRFMEQVVRARKPETRPPETAASSARSTGGMTSTAASSASNAGDAKTGSASRTKESKSTPAAGFSAFTADLARGDAGAEDAVLNVLAEYRKQRAKELEALPDLITAFVGVKDEARATGTATAGGAAAASADSKRSS